MATIQKLIPLVASSAILLAVDGLYLNNIGIATFKKNVELIQKSPLELNMYGALLSYVCVIGVLYYFIISQHKPVFDAFLLGILLYGTFDMTNISMFKQYAWKTALIDTLWGGILFAFTTWATYAFVKLI
jgi:uncharacterized membrane protein